MKTKLDSVSKAWEFAVVYLAGLLNSLEHNKSVTPDWNMLERIIQALPLGTNDFGPLSNRLNAAQQYLTKGEPGAARFELRQLRGRLERLRSSQGW